MLAFDQSILRPSLIALLIRSGAEVCLREPRFPASADVAQPVEHLFCKQVVRGSSPLVSSRRVIVIIPEGCPSGQREQTVNLPAHAFVGSNPTPSTRARNGLGHSAVSGATGGKWPDKSAGAKHASGQAGVAQLVERQPSKLNVAGSNPVSRSRKPTTHKLMHLPT